MRGAGRAKRRLLRARSGGSRRHVSAIERKLASPPHRKHCARASEVIDARHGARALDACARRAAASRTQPTQTAGSGRCLGRPAPRPPSRPRRPPGRPRRPAARPCGPGPALRPPAWRAGARTAAGAPRAGDCAGASACGRVRRSWRAGAQAVVICKVYVTY